MSTRPSILIARNVFPEVVAKLREHFDVDTNDEDNPLSPSQLAERLQGKVGVITTGSERVDAALIAACPQLKIVANIAVGYNNFDLDAMTANLQASQGIEASLRGITVASDIWQGNICHRKVQVRNGRYQNQRAKYEPCTRGLIRGGYVGHERSLVHNHRSSAPRSRCVETLT